MGREKVNLGWGKVDLRKRKGKFKEREEAGLGMVKGDLGRKKVEFGKEKGRLG